MPLRYSTAKLVHDSIVNMYLYSIINMYLSVLDREIYEWMRVESNIVAYPFIKEVGNWDPEGINKILEYIGVAVTELQTSQNTVKLIYNYDQ